MDDMTNISIRGESPADYGDIARVINLAFSRPNESDLVNALRETSAFDPELSLIALVHRDRVVAHLLFYPIHIETKSGEIPTLALAPLAVEPDHQNRGIGDALIRRGLEVAREKGHASIIVLGHAKYYPRFGFEKASRFGIRSVFQTKDESFMALELREDALRNAAGLVIYPEVYMRF